MPIFADHYFQVPDNDDLAYEEFCRQKNLLYFYKKKLKCLPCITLGRLIVLASGSNFTLKLYVSQYYNHSKTYRISN